MLKCLSTTVYVIVCQNTSSSASSAITEAGDISTLSYTHTVTKTVGRSLHFNFTCLNLPFVIGQFFTLSGLFLHSHENGLFKVVSTWVNPALCLQHLHKLGCVSRWGWIARQELARASRHYRAAERGVHNFSWDPSTTLWRHLLHFLTNAWYLFLCDSSIYFIFSRVTKKKKKRWHLFNTSPLQQWSHSRDWHQ